MKRIEATIQRSLIHWVKTSLPDVMLTTTSNENHFREKDQIGCLGISDLILFRRHNNILHCFFLELKTKQKSSRLNDNQLAWMDIFDSQYAASNTTRSVAVGYADAKGQIIQWLATFSACQSAAGTSTPEACLPQSSHHQCSPVCHEAT